MSFECRPGVLRLVGPVDVVLVERRAGGAEEEPVGRPSGCSRHAAAEVLRRDLVRNPALVVVVGRHLAALDEVLIRRRRHVPVEREQRVLVGAVRVHEPVLRDDVVRERRADEAAGARRIRPHRQRIVNLILTAVRQREQVGEIAVEVLLVGRHRARRRALGRRVVVVALVVAEEEQLVAAVHHLRDDDRAAQRESRCSSRSRLRRSSRSRGAGRTPASAAGSAS